MEIKNISIDEFTNPTGDPFADVGGCAIKEFAERSPDKSLIDLIAEVTQIYVGNWGAKINPFFLNSKITQPAFDAKKKTDETMKYFQSLLDGTAEHIMGFCRITGKETNLFVAGRDNSILSGSGGFVNFHHTFEKGIMLSKEALIRFHFVPIACQLLQGRIALIHSSEPKATEFFARKNVSKNLWNIASGISETAGILKSACRTPGTAMFRFIDEIISDADNKIEQNNFSLTLYHFTNFGASPEVKIYTIPSILFSFYNFMQRGEYREQWNRFVSVYYSNSDFKGAHLNKETSKMVWSKKGEISEFESKEYGNWSNVIYNRLLNDQSIITHIRKWSEKEKFNFKIVEIYQINIRNMKQETIKKIKEMTDFIFNANKDNIHGIEKAIKKLNGVKSGYLLRRFVIRDIVAKFYEKEKESEKAIITVEEYADYLFPDSSSWSEMRDVLLIAIYQKLHEENMTVEVPMDDNEDELNENE
jgi:CRISPR-associated protein Cst1